MTEKNKDKIIEDIIAIAPELASQRAALKTVVAELLDAKQQIAIDEDFIHRLRAQLQQKKAAPQSLRETIMDYSSRIFPIAGTVAAMAIVVVAGAVYVNRQALESPASYAQLFHPSETIALRDAAFGSLSAGRIESGGEIATMQAEMAPPGAGGGNGDAAASPMILPRIMYDYEYVGDPLPVPAAEGVVYRRRAAEGAQNLYAKMLQHAGGGLMDIASFDNITMDSITLHEDKHEGYSISIDLSRGRASIHPHWDMWATQVKESMRPQDLPTDDAVIAVADRFLAAHDIQMDVYAAPTVDNRWKEQGRGERQYVPDVITVTYPLQLDGRMVTDNAGQPHGMRVSVDVKPLRVQGVYDIVAGSFEESQYALEQDTKTILDLATRRGGVAPEEVEQQTIQLGTPTLTYIPYHMREGKQERELYIPAYHFPVVNPSDELPFYQQSGVTVPLVKEIVAAQKGRGAEPPMHIMESEPLSSNVVTDGEIVQ